MSPEFTNLHTCGTVATPGQRISPVRSGAGLAAWTLAGTVEARRHPVPSGLAPGGRGVHRRSASRPDKRRHEMNDGSDERAPRHHRRHRRRGGNPGDAVCSTRRWRSPSSICRPAGCRPPRRCAATSCAPDRIARRPCISSASSSTRPAICRRAIDFVRRATAADGDRRALPLQSRRDVPARRASATRRSPPAAGRSRSIRTCRRRSTMSASSITSATNSTTRSRIIGARSRSRRAMSRPTAISAMRCGRRRNTTRR